MEEGRQSAHALVPEDARRVTLRVGRVVVAAAELQGDAPLAPHPPAWRRVGAAHKQLLVAAGSELRPPQSGV
eukprot:579064-Prymnesium_polylepis.1